MIALLRLLAVSVGLLIVAAPLAAEELTTGASPASTPHGSMNPQRTQSPKQHQPSACLPTQPRRKCSTL